MHVVQRILLVLQREVLIGLEVIEIYKLCKNKSTVVYSIWILTSYRTILKEREQQHELC